MESYFNIAPECLARAEWNNNLITIIMDAIQHKFSTTFNLQRQKQQFEVLIFLHVSIEYPTFKYQHSFVTEDPDQSLQGFQFMSFLCVSHV